MFNFSRGAGVSMSCSLEKTSIPHGRKCKKVPSGDLRLLLTIQSNAQDRTE